MIQRPPSCARTQRGDLERFGKLLDLRQHGRRERHAVAFAFGPARRASHAGHANLIAGGQPVRGHEVANVAVDLGLERGKRNESRDIERDDELPDIALSARGRGEIPDISAEGCAAPARVRAEASRRSLKDMAGVSLSQAGYETRKW